MYEKELVYFRSLLERLDVDEVDKYIIENVTKEKLELGLLNELFLLTVMAKRTNLVKHLLQQGVNINHSSAIRGIQTNFSALLIACANNDSDTLRLLLSSEAAKANPEKPIEDLLKLKIDNEIREMLIKIRDNQEAFATIKGNIKYYNYFADFVTERPTTDELIEIIKSAQNKLEQSWKNILLARALSNLVGLEVIKALEDIGARFPVIWQEKGKSKIIEISKLQTLALAINRHSQEDSQEEIIAQIKEYNKDYKFSSKIKNQLFIGLFLKNYFEAAKYMLACGASVDCCIIMNSTALYHTASTNNIKQAKFLLDNGANIDMRYSVNNVSVLHVAAITNNEKMISFFIEAGADLYAQTKDEKYPEDLLKNENVKKRIETIKQSYEEIKNLIEDYNEQSPSEDKLHVLKKIIYEAKNVLPQRYKNDLLNTVNKAGFAIAVALKTIGAEDLLYSKFDWVPKAQINMY